MAVKPVVLSLGPGPVANCMSTDEKSVSSEDALRKTRRLVESCTARSLSLSLCKSRGRRHRFPEGLVNYSKELCRGIVTGTTELASFRLFSLAALPGSPEASRPFFQATPSGFSVAKVQRGAYASARPCLMGQRLLPSNAHVHIRLQRLLARTKQAWGTHPKTLNRRGTSHLITLLAFAAPTGAPAKPSMALERQNLKPEEIMG